MIAGEQLDSLQQFAAAAWDGAVELGLAPYPVEFELVPDEAIFELASYGMPGHWNHWTYGRDYWQVKQRLEQGAGRLYELVVNTNPAHAYLLDSNTMAAQKLVICHVYGHSDVFANHWWFQATPKDMDRSMAAARERFEQYEVEWGWDRVEATLDRALSLSQQVAAASTAVERPLAATPSPYADLLGHPAPRRLPPRLPLPTGDLLGFLAVYSPILEDWERDILETVRREALYFLPQRETKVIHEGYATWVHHTLLNRLDMAGGEALEAALIHARVVAPHPLQLNPYRLGFQMLSELARRHGPETMRHITLQETDASLVRNWMDQEMLQTLQLYQYRWQNGVVNQPTGPIPTLDAVVAEPSWENLRDQIANQLAYQGPRVVVDSVDASGRLVLRHVSDGLALEESWAQGALDHVHQLWGAPVHLLRDSGPALASHVASSGQGA